MADLFLSYHGPDRDAVRAVQQLVQARGVTTFLDRDSLPRGLPWPQALEDGLKACRGVAVFLSRELGAWQKRELWYALDRQAAEERQGRTFPVIPVLLPGADPGSGFLFLNTWVDLREDPLNATEIDTLVASLAGSETPPTSARVDVGICPYRGLYAFREEDAPFFHGREEVIDRLVEKVTTSKLAVVIGSSGCGKSSIVTAGLVPRLRRKRPPKTTWDVVAFMPGRAPLRRLARGLVGWLEPDLSPIDLAGRSELLGAHFESGRSHPSVYVEEGLRKSGADRLLLVVDQFEEIFTEAPPEFRQTFARAILEMVHQCPLVPVMTLRADFYGHAIDLNRDLTVLLEAGGVPVGGLRRDELRHAIVKPAQSVGLAFEPPLLIEKLLDDVGDEPGNLPLLEYALTELWNGRQNAKLLESTYRGFGGVRGAIAVRAEVQLNRVSNPDAVRRVMTSLVQTTPSTQGIKNTRRRVAVADLGEAAPSVVAEFAKPDVRLLVTSRDEAGRETVEVAHEALIDAWAQLRTWLAQDLELRLWRQRLEVALQYWDRDPSNLLTGLALAEGEKWWHERGADLLPRESALIHASVDARNAAIQQDARRQQEELNASQALAEQMEARAGAEQIARKEADARVQAQHEKQRRTRLLASVLAVLFAVTAVIGGWAFLAQRRVNETLDQIVKSLRLQVDSDDARLVLSALDQLTTVYGRGIDEVISWIPAERLGDNRWYANLAITLDTMGRENAARQYWVRDVSKGLSEGVSKARHIDAPDWPTHYRKSVKLIQGGEFVMGSSAVDPDLEDREHKVSVASFRMQEHEVTNEEYWQFDRMRVPPGHAEVAPQFKIFVDRTPVTGVTWFDAMAYAAWLGGSLPTEAEWEITARGVEGRKYPWGEEEITCSRAIHSGCAFGPVPVMDEREDGRTPDGVYDLAGNVWEWCRDWQGPYPGDGAIDPLGPPGGSARVMRGGSWRLEAKDETSFRGAHRRQLLPEFSREDVGFRVVWRANLPD